MMEIDDLTEETCCICGSPYDLTRVDDLVVCAEMGWED
jgi:hypothetical protein